MSGLFVVDDRGDQAFEFILEPAAADLVTSYHPLRLFSGKALVGAGDTAFYDLADRWFPIPTRAVGRFATDAVVVLAPDCTRRPRLRRRCAGRGLASARARRDHPSGDFCVGRDPNRRRPGRAGAAAPGCPSRLRTAAATAARSPTTNTTPAGSARAKARGSCCSSVRSAATSRSGLTLRGDGQAHAADLGAPAALPAILLPCGVPARHLPGGPRVGVVPRPLPGQRRGHVHDARGSRIVNVRRLVDPETIDAEYLPWLASWVGAVVEPDWEPARQRLLVRHAAQMFTRRGTQRGLVEAIQLATHPCPTDAIFEQGAATGAFDVRIVESFRTRSTAGVVFGNPNDLRGPGFSTPGATWQLEDGAAQLQQRWRRFLSDRHAHPGVTLSEAVAAAWGTSTLAVGDPPSFPALTPTIAAAAGIGMTSYAASSP